MSAESPSCVLICSAARPTVWEIDGFTFMLRSVKSPLNEGAESPLNDGAEGPESPDALLIREESFDNRRVIECR